MQSNIEGIELFQETETSEPKNPDFVSPDKIKEQVDLIYEKMSKGIGHGKTAEVVYIPEYKTDVCYKIIAQKRLEDLYDSTSEAPSYNNPKIEAYFLSRTGEVHRNVKTPQPLCYWEGTSDLLGKFKILVLEKLNAFTVQELLMNTERLNPDFDIQKFSDDLTDFVAKMNAEGIHHNDITVTNIMIDRETGAPYVIDFGDADKEFGEEKRPFTKDKVAIKDVIDMVKNHLKHQVKFDN
jgi:tRNA A-37 threonylcarbamoyl transferase component Bud32